MTVISFYGKILHILKEVLLYMNRIFIKEADTNSNYKNIEKTKVLVTGLSSNSGVSFVATCIAHYLKTLKLSISFLELEEYSRHRSLLYDSAAFEQRFISMPFISFHQKVLDGEKIRGLTNLDEGINWAILSPSLLHSKEGFALSPEAKNRLINNLSGEIIIATDDNLDNIPEYDYIVCVVDPFPSKLLAGKSKLLQLKKLEVQNNNVIYIINKLSSSIPKKEILEYLKIKAAPCIGLLDEKLFYEDEFNCKFHYNNKKIWSEIEKPIKELISGAKKLTHKV